MRTASEVWDSVLLARHLLVRVLALGEEDMSTRVSALGVTASQVIPLTRPTDLIRSRYGSSLETAVHDCPSLSTFPKYCSKISASLLSSGGRSERSRAASPRSVASSSTSTELDVSPENMTRGTLWSRLPSGYPSIFYVYGRLHRESRLGNEGRPTADY